MVVCLNHIFDYMNLFLKFYFSWFVDCFFFFFCDSAMNSCLGIALNRTPFCCTFEGGVAGVLPLCVGVAGFGGALALLGVTDLDRDCERRIRVGGVGTLIPPSSPLPAREHSSGPMKTVSTGGFSWSLSSSPAGVEGGGTGECRGRALFPWSPCRCIVQRSSHWTSIALSAGTQLELEEGGSASQALDWEGFSSRQGSLESSSFLSSHALHLTRSFLHSEGPPPQFQILYMRFIDYWSSLIIIMHIILPEGRII